MIKILAWWMMILALHVIQLVFDESENTQAFFFITFGLSVIPNFFTHLVFSQDSLVNADTFHIFFTFLTHWFHIYISYFITILTVFVNFKFYSYMF